MSLLGLPKAVIRRENSLCIKLYSSGVAENLLYFKLQGISEKQTSQRLFVTNRAVASNRQTEALASVISFVFVVYSHHKYPKYT